MHGTNADFVLLTQLAVQCFRQIYNFRQDKGSEKVLTRVPRAPLLLSHQNGYLPPGGKASSVLRPNEDGPHRLEATSFLGALINGQPKIDGFEAGPRDEAKSRTVRGLVDNHRVPLGAREKLLHAHEAGGTVALFSQAERPLSACRRASSTWGTRVLAMLSIIDWDCREV